MTIDPTYMIEVFAYMGALMLTHLGMYTCGHRRGWLRLADVSGFRRAHIFAECAEGDGKPLAEAEDLRSSIEFMIEDAIRNDEKVRWQLLQMILDETDARDSLAYLIARDEGLLNETD